MDRPTTTTELRYPASGHILRYARLAFDASDPSRTEGLMPALPDLCDAGGGIRLGAISLLADFAAGTSAVASVSPDWPVTHDMALHLVRPAPPEGELEAVCTVTRAGRNSVTSETAVVSPVVGEVARAYVTFTRLARRNDTPTGSRLSRINLAESPDLERPRAPLDEAAGFRLERPTPETGTGPEPGTGTGMGAGPRAAGDGSYVEFDHDPFIVNSLGAIQGGVIALALERSVSWAAQLTLGQACRTTDLHLHYLALGRTGPFQARAEVLRMGAGHVVSRASLHDTGDDDRILALGVGTAELIDPD